MEEPMKPTGPTIPAPTDIKKPVFADPTLPGGPPIKVPADDKKKAEGDDIFKAPEPPAIDPKKVDPTAPPAPLPSTVNERKEKPKTEVPVIRVGVSDPSIPDPPKVPAADGKKDDAGKKPDAPAIPSIPDITAPPIPAADKKSDAPIIPPPPPDTKVDAPIVAPPAGIEKKDHPRVKDNTVPSIDVPTVGGETKIDPPLPPLGPMPTVKTPDGPPIPTIDPVPTIKVPAPGTKIEAPPTVPSTNRNTYEEDWHTWTARDTYAGISQEYYHDGKYAAALEAYNKEHRKAGDPIVRVPPTWKLDELYPNLIGKSAEKPERATPEARPAGNGGIKFEPVAPLPGAGKTAATPTSRTDEYKVTAEAGEMIRDVARKALGNADSWRKISSLNPDLDPTLPIPAGTVVKLPK
jgi:hypothetical protein